jgi:glycerol-3-phosphate O-acyltransferase/nucleoside-diphosphate-sugar epimerase
MASPAPVTSPYAFFPRKQLFITGSTGFLGKVVLEKLLREVPDVGKIFLLIRPCPKKGTSPSVRLREEIIASPLFARLRKNPTFEATVSSKLVLIEGDLDRDGFGLGESDLHELVENVDVVLHCGGASDWNERLEVAMRRNVHATMQLLTLAKQMKRLKAFVHVSSAYVVCREGGAKEVEERIYPLGFDVDDVVHQLSTMKSKKLSKSTPKLLQKFANTHAFTKAMAEIMILSHKENVPVFIVRPSFLGATYREPFSGWVDSLSVAGTLFTYTGLGMVNFVPGNPDHLVDIVPCDYASNLILTAIAQLGSWPEGQLAAAEDIPIFHISSSHHPLTWGYAAQTMTKYWQKHTPKQAIGTPSVYMIKNRHIYAAQFLLKYKAPSKIYGALSRILGSSFHRQQSQRLTSLVSKCQSLNEHLFHFVDNQWIFDTSHSDRLRDESLSLSVGPGTTHGLAHTGETRRSVPASRMASTASSSKATPTVFTPASPLATPSLSKSTIGSSMTDAVFTPPVDGIGFDFDFTTIDWHEFINYYCWGLSKFVLKETGKEIERPPTRQEMRHGRLLSRDLDGRFMSKPWLADFYFCYNASRSVAYPSVRQQRELNSKVLSSAAVREAMKQVSQSKSIPEAVLEVKAKEIMDRMATMQQKIYLKVLAWFFRKIWRHIYQLIDVNENVLMKLFEYQSKKSSIVLIPSHRSYIDFLIISYILYAYDFPAPMIAAGEDFLNMSFVSNLLRFGGAFFLRRTFRGDTLYNAIFTEYVQSLLTMGFPIEFFVEGTRSRSGKLLQPKLGLVTMLTDTFFNHQVSDITFFPININYEKVMEDAAYTREWMGEKKKAENLENLLKASSIFKTSWGRISLKFCAPIPLSTYTERFTKFKNESRSLIASPSNDDSHASASSSSSSSSSGAPKSASAVSKKYDCFQNEDDRKDLNTALAHQIIYDINDMTIWSPLAVVGSILLMNRTGGMGMNLLLQRVDWLIGDILRRRTGCEEWITEFAPDEIATRALNDFGEVLTQKQRSHQILLAEPKSALILAFYRNRLLHVFARDAYILSTYLALSGLKDAANPFHAKNKNKSSSNARSSSIQFPAVSVHTLLEEAEFLALVINKEFVYKVHPDESERLPETLETMLELGWLERVGTDEVRLTSSEIAHDALFYFSSLITSFIDSYWTALLTISALRPSSSPRNAFGQRIHECADRLLAEGVITTMESCSRETLNAALSTMLRIRVLKGENFGEAISVAPNQSSQQLLALLTRLTQLRTSPILNGSAHTTPLPQDASNKSLNPETGAEDLARSLVASFPIPAKL